MEYKALYRSFRPRSFDKIVGQGHITDVLERQVQTGRVAHAYLFCGPRGTGKTTTALVFARAINCAATEGKKPCGVCGACTDAENDIYEIDAASNNGVDQIRDLREKVRFAPVSGAYKVYIVDEVHMLSAGAFNALLKTLEEPPHHVVFILATTEPHKLPATIISRCQRFDFHRVPKKVIVSRMKEIAAAVGAEFDDRALDAIAAASEGGLRDALTVMDQLIAFVGGRVTYEDVLEMLGSVGEASLAALAGAIAESDAGKAIDTLDAILERGHDLGVLIRDFNDYLRDVMLCCIGALPEDRRDDANIQELAKKMGRDRVLRALGAFMRAEADMKWASQPRIVLESALARVCIPEAEASVEALIDRVAALEREVRDLRERGVAAAPAADAREAQIAEAKAERIEKQQDTVIMFSLKDNPGPLNKGNGAKADTEKGANGTAVWKNVLAALKQVDMSVYVLALDAADFMLRDGVAELVYTEDKAIFADAFKKPPYSDKLVSAIEKATGRKYELLLKIKKPEEKDLASAVIDLLGSDKVEIE